jgi:hypothetical protein
MNSHEGMFDIQVIGSPVKIGNEKALTATNIGKRRWTVVQKNGDTVHVTLTKVNFLQIYGLIFSGLARDCRTVSKLEPKELTSS